MQSETAVATTILRRPASPRRSEQRRSQLVVGLDPRLDLLPLELRGDAHVGRPAAAEAVGAVLLRDHRRGRAVRRGGQAAARVLRGARRRRDARRSRGRARYARAAGLLVIVDGEARRHRLDGPARTPTRTSSRARPAAARGRADGQPVSRPRLARAVRRRLPARTAAGCSASSRPRTPGGVDVQDLTLSDGRPRLAAGRPARPRVGRGPRRRLRALERRRGRRRDATRARSARRGGCCRRRSCSCRASARRGRARRDIARAFTSGPASALVAASRSVIYAFRDGEDDWRAAAAAEAARLSHEVWTVSGW